MVLQAISNAGRTAQLKRGVSVRQRCRIRWACMYVRWACMWVMWCCCDCSGMRATVVIQSRSSQGAAEIANASCVHRAGNGSMCRSLVFDLSITHDRFGSSTHVAQNGLLLHPQDLDAPPRLAAQRKINSYRQHYADNQNISFLPAL